MKGSVAGPLARRRRFGGSRSRRSVAAVLASLAGVLVLSGPVPALGVTQPGDSPCLASTGSVTLSASTVYAGQSVSASWTTHRPSGCGGVVSALSGPNGAYVQGGVGGTGTLTPLNMGVNTYTVSVFYAGGSVDVAWGSVTVQPPPTAMTDPAQMCVGAAGGNSADGTQVELENCNGTAGQQPATSEQDGTIQVMGKCLDLAAGNVSQGTAVQLKGCNSSGTQVWATSGTMLVNPASGLCLGAAGGSTAAGTPLQIGNCSAAGPWTMPQGSTLPVNGAPSGSPSCPVSVSTPIQVTVSTPTPDQQLNAMYSASRTTCNAQVATIRLDQILWIGNLGIQEGQDGTSPTSVLDSTLATSVTWGCHAGLWSSSAVAVITTTVPRHSFTVGPVDSGSLDVSEQQCARGMVGMSDSAARSYIQQEADWASLGTVTMVPSDTIPFGDVISTSLENDGRTVDLVESESHYTVPNLIGDEAGYAISDIGEDSLVLGNETFRDDCISPGDVEGQTPGAGTYYDSANPPTVNIIASDCDGTPK